MACASPPSITGGSVTTTGPYANASTAVYQCSTGYLMTGTSYIECINTAWTGSTPVCTLQDMNNVQITNNYDNEDFPTWLVYLIGAVVVLLVLLLLTCLLIWCCQLLGCFAAGGMFGEMQPRNSWCCCIRRRNRYSDEQRMCRTFPRRYEYDEDGRRYHIDDLGRRCYYQHKNKQLNGRVVGSTASDTTTEETPRTTFVQAVNEVMVNEKRQLPAKEVHAWRPHANPVRNINTSTK